LTNEKKLCLEKTNLFRANLIKTNLSRATLYG